VRIVRTIIRPYSQLARASIRFRDGEVLKTYIKLYRHPKLPHTHNQDSAEREHSAHKTLHEAFQGLDGCTVVRPIAVFREWGGWVMENVDGRTLDSILRTKGNRISSVFSMAKLRRYASLTGRWLQHFQRSTRHDATVSLESAGVRQEIESALEDCEAFAREERDRIIDCSERLCSQTTQTSLGVVGQHGECFTPHHIFVSKGRVVVFDITGIKDGPAYEDLASLWVSLEAMLKYPLFKASDVEELQAAYLEGFSAEREIDESVFQLYVLKHMLKLLASWTRRSKGASFAALRSSAGRRFARNWLLNRVRD